MEMYFWVWDDTLEYGEEHLSMVWYFSVFVGTFGYETRTRKMTNSYHCTTQTQSSEAKLAEMADGTIFGELFVSHLLVVYTLFLS